MILYIEQQILDHPRTKQICNSFPKSQKIIIQHYKNIFDKTFPNPPAFSDLPASEVKGPQREDIKGKNILVLAKLTGTAISQAPDGYGHAGE